MSCPPRQWPIIGARPIAVFRYSDTEGPGHFATFLDAQRLPWKLVKLDAGGFTVTPS